MQFYTYILQSSKDLNYYYGHCFDLEKRLKRHNDGHVKSTKSRRPFVVHYIEMFENKSDAFKREQFFKTIDGYNWLKQNKII